MVEPLTTLCLLSALHLWSGSCDAGDSGAVDSCAELLQCLFGASICDLDGRRQINPVLANSRIASEQYNPNPGFEKYWQGGDWVYETVKVGVVSTMTPPRMCGEPCPQIYINYGPVCGRDYFGNQNSYATYCELRNDDCSENKGIWIAHRGHCTPNIKVWDPEGANRVSRVRKYLSTYYSKFATAQSTLFLPV